MWPLLSPLSVMNYTQWNWIYTYPIIILPIIMINCIRILARIPFILFNSLGIYYGLILILFCTYSVLKVGDHCHAFAIIIHTFVIITAISEQQTKMFAGIIII